MEEILHHLKCIKPCKNKKRWTTNLNWCVCPDFWTINRNYFMYIPCFFFENPSGLPWKCPRPNKTVSSIGIHWMPLDHPTSRCKTRIKCLNETPISSLASTHFNGRKMHNLHFRTFTIVIPIPRFIGTDRKRCTKQTCIWNMTTLFSRKKGNLLIKEKERGVVFVDSIFGCQIHDFFLCKVSEQKLEILGMDCSMAQLAITILGCMKSLVKQWEKRSTSNVDLSINCSSWWKKWWGPTQRDVPRLLCKQKRREGKQIQPISLKSHPSHKLIQLFWTNWMGTWTKITYTLFKCAITVSRLDFFTYFMRIEWVSKERGCIAFREISFHHLVGTHVSTSRGNVLWW